MLCRPWAASRLIFSRGGCLISSELIESDKLRAKCCQVLLPHKEVACVS